MSFSPDVEVSAPPIRNSGRHTRATASEATRTRVCTRTKRAKHSSAKNEKSKQTLIVTDKRTRQRCEEPKLRTRTSEVRRDEIDLLQKESKSLEVKVEFLKYRAGIFNQQTLSQQVLDNALCREFLRNHNLSMAGLKIILNSDPIERHKFLLAIKSQKIHDARQYLERHTQFLDMTKQFSDTNQFETADGEICSTKLDVNVEINTADINGDIALREEAETGDESVWLNRLVFLKKEFGVDVENNNAVFCEYSPSVAAGAERSDEQGLITIDFVDEDELYPYRPHERLRDNVTAAIVVKSYRLPPRDCSSEQANQPNKIETVENQEEVVVLTRWVQASFHRGESNNLLSDDALFELRKDSDRVSDAVLSLVRARFSSSTPYCLVPNSGESDAVVSEENTTEAQHLESLRNLK